MVNKGAMVSVIQLTTSKVQVQTCDVKARGITGIHLKVLGEQVIELFVIKAEIIVRLLFTHL